jgi:hypothetical protein
MAGAGAAVVCCESIFVRTISRFSRQFLCPKGKLKSRKAKQRESQAIRKN